MNPVWVNRSPLRQHVGPRGEAKRPFDAKDDAAAYAAELNTRPNASKRRPYGVYRCQLCGLFHVGRKRARS